MAMLRLKTLSLNRHVAPCFRPVSATVTEYGRWFASDAKDDSSKKPVNKSILNSRKTTKDKPEPVLSVYPQDFAMPKFKHTYGTAKPIIVNQKTAPKAEKETEPKKVANNVVNEPAVGKGPDVVKEQIPNKPKVKPQEILQTCEPSLNATPPPPPPPKSNTNIWFAVLAAIASGGLLTYFLRSPGDEGKKQEVVRSTGPVENKKVPATSAEIPREVPYLLIGGGTASFAAFRAIKSHDPKAKVLVISNEVETPYMRPPLSKELWLSHESNGTNGNAAAGKLAELKFKQWNGVERSLYYEPNDFYINPTKLLDEANGGVAIVRGYTVAKIDVQDRTAILTDGTPIKYNECLLATGSSPKNLDVIERAPRKIQDKCSVFKNIEDYERLKKVIDKSKSVAVIGGGFLGSELACALAKYGESRKLKVHQIFHEKGNMGKVLPEFLSEWTTERVREEGVNVIPNTQIQNVELINGRLSLKLIDGQTVLCDHAVVAVGSAPNVTLAQESGLEVDRTFGGYLVNAELEARRHLYVAGDAACFYDPKLGRRRVEHHDHAVVSGRLAGENMVGLKKPYTHQSMFWSDLGPKVGYEAIGVIDATLPTVSVFAKRTPEELNSRNPPSDASASPATKAPAADTTTESTSDNDKEEFDKGVVFYLRDEKIIGIVLWNVFNRINTARAVIGEGKKYDDLNEVAKLFDIHT